MGYFEFRILTAELEENQPQILNSYTLFGGEILNGDPPDDNGGNV